MRPEPSWLRQRVRASVGLEWRLRGYVAGLALVFASVPLLHLYLDVDLSVLELAVHAVDVSLGTLCIILLVEAAASSWQRSFRWRIDLSRLAVVGLSAAFVVAALVLQEALHDLLPLSGGIRAKHEAAGYRDMSLRVLPVVAVLVYIVVVSVRGRWLAAELEALRALSEKLERVHHSAEMPERASVGGSFEVRVDGERLVLPARSIIAVKAEENYCRIQLAREAAHGESSGSAVRQSFSSA